MSSTLSSFSGYLAIEQESCICSLRDFPGTKLPRVDSFGRSQVALILKQCGDGGYLQTGKLAHASICQNKQLYRDKFIQNLVLRMYGKCGALQDAFKEFEGMASRNAFTWNIMLASYAQQEQLDPAMTFFLQMPERNTVSWNTMITAIAQLGQLQEALTLFQVMPEKNVVSWNAIIAACAQHGLAEEALQLFQQMKLHDVIPDKAAFASILAICGNQEAIGKGKRIHAQVLSSSFICDDVVNNALVSMYGRCGFLAGALKLFEHMYKKTTTLWNAMIEVLALNGYGRDCHLLFSEMQLQGIGPDKITYVGLLQVL